MIGCLPSMCKILGLIPQQRGRETETQRHRDIDNENKLCQNVTKNICPRVLGNMRKIFF